MLISLNEYNERSRACSALIIQSSSATYDQQSSTNRNIYLKKVYTEFFQICTLNKVQAQGAEIMTVKNEVDNIAIEKLI